MVTRPIMAQCNNCDAHLTEQYAKVFGNRDNEVDYCLHCVDGSRVNERATSGVGDING